MCTSAHCVRPTEFDIETCFIGKAAAEDIVQCTEKTLDNASFYENY